MAGLSESEVSPTQRDVFILTENQAAVFASFNESALSGLSTALSSLANNAALLSRVR